MLRRAGFILEAQRNLHAKEKFYELSVKLKWGKDPHFFPLSKKKNIRHLIYPVKFICTIFDSIIFYTIWIRLVAVSCIRSLPPFFLSYFF